jgi:SAM-dependent MidA family methyltransferase
MSPDWATTLAAGTNSQEGAAASPTGRRGDFITSVSVGACYGQLLAEQVAQYWKISGEPSEFHLIEQGANDGQLMADILAALAQGHPRCADSIQPHFIEPLSSAAVAQRQRVPWAQQHSSCAELHFPAGVFFCNELVDAFPVQRIQWNGSAWHELGVALDAEGEFQEMVMGPALSLQIHTAGFMDGYTTECCPRAESWLAEISHIFAQGLWLIIDYGLTAADYYAPYRSQGSLRGYQKHRMVTENLLDCPGQIDLTTHVNWTTLTQTAERCGLEHHGWVDQMRFLTALAEPVLKNMEQAASMTPQHHAWLRQFQTLTQPGQMGSKFQALLLTRGPCSIPLHGVKYARPFPV